MERYTLAVLGVVKQNGEVLLVQTHFGGLKWQLPGGFVESGENITAALKREFKEELKVIATAIKPIGIYIRNTDIALAAEVTISQKKIEMCDEELKVVFDFSK